MCIGLTFTHFRLSGKVLDANVVFIHVVTVLKIKSHFLKREAGISPDKAFLTSKSFMILFMVFVVARLNGRSLFILFFLL